MNTNRLGPALTVTVRIQEKDYEILREIAKDEDRSINALIRRAIREMLDNR
jgi:hypothetical protein